MMFDMLKTIQKYLLNNATIAQYCKGRIRAYYYDETADTSGPYILISPLIAPQPSTYASDTNLSTEYLYQIDVRGPNYDVVKLLQEEIRKTLWNIGYCTFTSRIGMFYRAIFIKMNNSVTIHRTFPM